MRPLLTLALLASCITLQACSRCSVVQARFAEVLRTELGQAGAGEQSDTGLTDHVRLVTTRDSIMDLAAPLLRRGWLRPLSAQRVSDAMSDTTLSVELVPRVTRLAVARAGREQAESRSVSATSVGIPATLSIEVVAYIRVESRESRGRLTTTAFTELGVRVEFAQEGWLIVDANDVTSATPLFDLSSVDPLHRDQIGRLAGALYQELVADADGTIRLAQWSTLTVAGRALPLTPSSLSALEDGSLHLGFVTPLRPNGAMAAPRPNAHTPSSWWVHPDLPRAAVEHYSVTGALPRRYNASGEADVLGSYAVTLGDIRVREEDLSQSVRVWCLEGARCTVEELAFASDVALIGGAISLSDERSLRGESGSAVRLQQWLTATTHVIRDVLSPPEIRLQGGERLAFEPARLRIGPGSIRLGGTMTVMPTGLAVP
ncbi:MAG: hypothetical protein ACI81R_003708 [Bradymonadia bacterium]|jgi:hypothetical protein